MKPVFFLLAAVVMLSGCSGEPSQSAMEKAVAKTIQDTIVQSRDIVKSMGGAHAGADLKDFVGFDEFEKLSCKPTEHAYPPDRHSWTCQFKFTASLNNQSQTATETGNFYQSDKGWQVELTGN